MAKNYHNILMAESPPATNAWQASSPVIHRYKNRSPIPFPRHVTGISSFSPMSTRDAHMVFSVVA